jgi:hypothetical protein
MEAKFVLLKNNTGGLFRLEVKQTIEDVKQKRKQSEKTEAIRNQVRLKRRKVM